MDFNGARARHALTMTVTGSLRAFRAAQHVPKLHARVPARRNH
mgnify:CR=1 FL=1